MGIKKITAIDIMIQKILVLLKGQQNSGLHWDGKDSEVRHSCPL